MIAFTSFLIFFNGLTQGKIYRKPPLGISSNRPQSRRGGQHRSGRVESRSWGRQLPWLEMSWGANLPGKTTKDDVNLYLVGGDWIMTFIFPYIGNHHPNWLSYFSEGFKPPTRYDQIVWWCECLWSDSIVWCKVYMIRLYVARDFMTESENVLCAAALKLWMDLGMFGALFVQMIPWDMIHDGTIPVLQRSFRQTYL